MNEKQRLLHLLERLLETYKEKIKLMHDVFLCNAIQLPGVWKIRLTAKELAILLNFMFQNRPLHRGMIGYDKHVKTDGRAYWCTYLDTPNNQSRLNFLVKHITRLKKELS